MIMTLLIGGVWLMRNRASQIASVNAISPTQTSFSSTGVQGTANVMPVVQQSSPGILQQLTGLAGAGASLAKFFGA